MSVIYFCFVNKLVYIIVFDSTYKHDILFIKKKLLYKLCVMGFSVTCFCSVTQSCLTLRDPMDCSTPGFPVPHYLLDLAQTHVSR